MRKHLPLAIAYDFDGTLAPGNMQERDFIPAIGSTTREFWNEVKKLSAEHEADNILVYMKLMLDKASAAKVPVRRQDFEQFGQKLKFFDGVEASVDEAGVREEGWFDRINNYGTASGVHVEHYVISSGIREMVEGSPIAKNFKKIYASSYWYDHNKLAVWPALALNYTTKTQYLFRINKGSPHVYDHDLINEYVAHQDRPVPFRNMVFIGDGETDIPCFRLVKDQGGHSIAVYQPSKRNARARAEKLIGQGRVNFTSPANYKACGRLEQIVKAIIDKISVDGYLGRFEP